MNFLIGSKNQSPRRPVAKLFTLLFCNYLAAALFPSLLFAQTPPQLQAIRTTADPAQAAEATTPIAQPIPKALPPQGLLMQTGTLAPEIAQIKFKLKRIHIKNPIILCEDELLEPYKDKFDTEITLGELQQIAQDMTTRYQKCGYILTQVIIPPQTIRKSGLVTFTVVSSHIHRIMIRGIQACPAKLIAEYGRAIKSCYPLHVKVLERYSLLANDIPGMKIKTVLSASKKAGATDLIFEGCQTLEEGSLNINNLNSRYLGPTQAILMAARNSWFCSGDQAQMYLVSSGDSKVNYGQFRYSELLTLEGLRSNLVYRNVYSRPGRELKQFDIRGRNVVYSYELMYPYIRSREENLYFQGSFNISEDQSYVLRTLLYNDRFGENEYLSSRRRIGFY